MYKYYIIICVFSSVSDPDPDPHVFDHLDPDPDPQKYANPGSGSRVTKLTKIGENRL